MARNRLITNSAALMAELRNLPARLQQEAQTIVFDTGDQAKVAIQDAYHEGPTGNLRRGVTIKKEYGQFSVTVLIRSRAKHAWLYEHGSQARHYTEHESGKVHATGTMPANPTFEPIMAQKRREMETRLASLVERAGITVVKT